jgi:curved DNA-binding protein CbpA
VDHYQTLQVSRHAEPEVIDRAWRALAKKYHPDTASPAEREKATRRLQRVNEAYAVLSDPVRRRAYDKTLPGTAGQGWERFMDAGLWGLFKDWLRSQPRR